MLRRGKELFGSGSRQRLTEAVAAGWRDRPFLLREESMKGVVASDVFILDALLPAENTRAAEQ